jgi:hypothetical protein
MNFDATRQVADAVLYEGYLLYPYRASAQKNRSRWQFGVLMPAGYVLLDPSEHAATRSECVLEGTDPLTVTVLLRFLQAQRRSVQAWQPDRGEFEPVHELPGPDGPITAWDEAVECELTFEIGADQLPEPGVRLDFAVPGGEQTEPVHDAAGALLGRLVRTRVALSGVLSVTVEPLPGPWGAMRLRLDVENQTPFTADPDMGTRDAALPAALIATHTIVGITGGLFVSMVDPPEWAQAAVTGCVNVGGWPVLAGPAGERDVLLCAPIILYDHPEVAPESPGDMFDSTEIDEILTLRTLALSDEERRAARATDPRAAALLDRTESLDAQTLDRLHGAIRYLRTVTGEAAPTNWDPELDLTAEPETEAVLVGGHRLARGSRVVLRPGTRRTDAQDMFLAGRQAVIEAVRFDLEDNPYLAVTLADDPGADLQRGHGRFLYFSPDEVEPCEVRP